MWTYLVLTLLGLTLGAGAAQSKDQAKTPEKCFPILRISGAAPTRPYGVIPYSVWHYVLYQPLCEANPPENAFGRVDRPPRTTALSKGCSSTPQGSRYHSGP